MNLTIKQARESDLERVCELFLQIDANPQCFEFPPLWKLGVYPTKEYLKDAIRKTELYIGTIGNELISSMILNQKTSDGYDKVSWPTDAENQDILVIHLLALCPNHIGKGYAQAMVRFAFEKAKEMKCKVIRLDILAKNTPSAKLYEKMGFHRIASIPLFYEDTGLTDFVLYEYQL